MICGLCTFNYARMYSESRFAYEHPQPNLPSTLHSAHIQAPPAVGHGRYSGYTRHPSTSNDLQRTSVGMPAALFHPAD